MAVLALIWGGSFVANRAALSEVPVLTVVALRVGIAAVLMWIWVGMRGLTLPRAPRLWLAFLGMGILNAALPFSLIVWGQSHIDSGLAAILNATTAIFGALVGAMAFADERLTLRKGLGVLVGFGGVVLVIGPEALAEFNLTSLAQIAVLAASLSYALAGAFTRRRIKGLAPEVIAAGMLAGASLCMLPAALLLDGVPSFDWTWTTWAGIFWLSAISSALAYLLYYRVLEAAGVANLSLVTLLIPPVAIVLGWALFDEALGWQALAGFALLAAGLVLLNSRPATQRPAKNP